MLSRTVLLVGLFSKGYILFIVRSGGLRVRRDLALDAGQGAVGSAFWLFLRYLHIVEPLNSEFDIVLVKGVTPSMLGELAGKLC